MKNIRKPKSTHIWYNEKTNKLFEGRWVKPKVFFWQNPKYFIKFGSLDIEISNINKFTKHSNLTLIGLL